MTSATTHRVAYDWLESPFPEVLVERDVKFVDEGNIITSGGISSGIHMAFHVVRKLPGVEIADKRPKRWNKISSSTR